VNPNYKEINAEQETGDPDSIYSYFRKMNDLRRSTKAFVYGEYKDLDPANQKVFAYTRTLGKEKYLVVLNFSKDEVSYTLPQGMKAGVLSLSNYSGKEENTGALKLKGWEARIYKM